VCVCLFVCVCVCVCVCDSECDRKVTVARMPLPAEGPCTMRGVVNVSTALYDKN